MNPKLRKILLARPLQIAAALIAFYFLFGYFAVNPIAQRLLPWVGEKKLASRLAVEEVKFDPLRLTLTVSNLHLDQLNGSNLAGFRRLFVDLDANGLWHWNWHLTDIRLSGPYGIIDIDPQGKLNWADLIAKLNEDKTPSDTMPRVVIDHILIEDGKVQYTERNRPTPFKTELTPLALELDGFSTLPKDRGDYLLSAKMPEQGGTLRWKGDVGVNPVASAGSVEVEGVNLASLMPILKRQQLPVTITDGRADVRFSYGFAMVGDKGEPQPQALLAHVEAKVALLAAELPGGKLNLGEAEANLPDIDLALQKGASLHVTDLDAHVRQLALTQSGKPLFKLGELAIKGIGYDLAENRLGIEDIALNGGEVHAVRDQNGQLDWLKLMPTNEAAPAKPEAEKKSPEPKAKPFRFDIAKLQLQHWKAGFEDQTFVHPLSAEIGNLDFSLKANSDENGLAVSGMEAALRNLTLRSSLMPQPAATLADLHLQSSGISLKDNTVNLGKLQLSGLESQVSLDAKQGVNWLALLEQRAATAKAAAPTASGPAWKVNLAGAALENGTIHVEDRYSGAPIAWDIQNAKLAADGLSLDLGKAVPIKAAFKIKQGGDFAAEGKLALAPLKGDLQIKLNGLPLKPFAPYLNRAAMLKLVDGQASTQGKLSINQGKILSAQYTGGFNVERLAIIEEVDNRPFLSWGSVASNSLKLSMAPNRLHMDEVRVVRPAGKLIIYEDRTLNVQHLIRTQAPTTASAKSGNGDSAVDQFPVAVDRISVDNADLEFADLSLVPQFGTHINSLSGVINGLSSDAASTAQVELDGKVDEYGSARVRGSLQPFRATDFTDLKVSFHNLEMNRLTPYSGKFAGRKIDSGKMSADLEYKIKNRQLLGENKFVINTLKLGGHVDSPDAVNLPLDLAIALLEDSNGVIDLDLPISGRLDDPQFSYGKVIWKAVVNVVSKVVTAPFRALGKLLGISSDKLEAVAFDPGLPTLAPPEQEKLKAVADAMGKKPQLTLRIAPAYDTAADTAALQDMATRRDVAREMGLTLAENEQPGPVDLNNVKVQTAVENLLKDRKGEKRNIKALDSVKDYFRKPKPEDLPKYQAMVDELKATVKVGDADLTGLGKARGDAIQHYLVQTAGLEAQRVTVQAPAKEAGDGHAVKVKLELGVAK
ncbi:uncharacterized protein NMK_1178 [Novimethylophilus kurashikiensis]|uniref:DUF748 domain-containing protein n=1 Tax=Novimethylophilus kurashikiensis TaxID=1825523 RepID=A0A2R5F5Q8_9PROT|nr:DUF748 domain-containing protein [Novimethylophilus kurashikiensis]GBG13627.1 uncharacterized protein NMK_1178 [Novimethylophilus kurashikiensis]